MSNGKVHCQCSNSIGGTSRDASYCRGQGNPLVAPHSHCVGPYEVDGYLFGDNSVGSVYATYVPGCTDTDNGATDSSGTRNCEYLMSNPVGCTLGAMFDDSDFTQSDMCCACLGGSMASTPPTPATPTPPVSATGDPHLQNVHGERFDLMKPGKHILINAPRGERADTALLRVAAEAHLLGKGCAGMYFQNVTVTGAWAEATHAGGYTFVSGSAADAAPQWLSFGPVGLKVARGHTDTGIQYLNVYVRGLGRAGHPVGSLLGEDDHAEEATPQVECMRKVQLQAIPKGHRAGPSWVASASL